MIQTFEKLKNCQILRETANGMLVENLRSKSKKPFKFSQRSRLMISQEKNNDLKEKPYKSESSEPIKAQDFILTVHNGIAILRVNSTQAIFSNASGFKTFCDSVMKDYSEIIIDLGRCQILDSAFIGAIVLSLKNAPNKNIDIKLVINDNLQTTLYQRSLINQLFKTFNTLNDALIDNNTEKFHDPLNDSIYLEKRMVS